MGVVKVGYRRVFQLRPYESQEITLSIETETPAKEVASEVYMRLYAQLQAVGEHLMIQALAVADPRDTGAKAAMPSGGRH